MLHLRNKITICLLHLKQHKQLSVENTTAKQHAKNINTLKTRHAEVTELSEKTITKQLKVVELIWISIWKHELELFKDKTTKKQHTFNIIMTKWIKIAESDWKITEQHDKICWKDYWMKWWQYENNNDLKYLHWSVFCSLSLFFESSSSLLMQQKYNVFSLSWYMCFTTEDLILKRIKTVHFSFSQLDLKIL